MTNFSRFFGPKGCVKGAKPVSHVQSIYAGFPGASYLVFSQYQSLSVAMGVMVIHLAYFPWPSAQA